MHVDNGHPTKRPARSVETWARVGFVLFALCATIAAHAKPTEKLACGMPVYVTNAGFFVSPSFPYEPYPNAVDCYYYINTEPGTLVQLVFYVFDTEENADFVTIYDGKGKTATKMAELSGNEPLRQVFTTNVSNSMTVNFKSDLDQVSTGFFGVAYPVDAHTLKPKRLVTTTDADCTQPAVQTHSSWNVLVSPGWPNQYENGQHCLYRIDQPDAKQIVLIFHFFSTEKDADFLKVYDGEPSENALLSFSGDIESGRNYTINSNNVTLEFFSDMEKRGDGFSIIIKS